MNKPTPKIKQVKLTGKSYTSVSDMVRGTTDSQAFADSFEARQSERPFIRSLTVLRCAKGISQGEVAEKMGCTQGKISKMESSLDADISLGDFANYSHAVGHNLRIVVSPEGATGVDHVRFHVASLKRELDRLVVLAGDDKEIGEGLELFAIKTMLNFVSFIQGAIGKLSRRSALPSKQVLVEIEGGLEEEEIANLPKRVRKTHKAPVVTA